MAPKYCMECGSALEVKKNETDKYSYESFCPNDKCKKSPNFIKPDIHGLIIYPPFVLLGEPIGPPFIQWYYLYLFQQR